MQHSRDQSAEDVSHWLAAIVESCDDAIISKDLDGVFMTWNRSAERIFGYTPEEAIGRPATILIPPDRQDEEPFILDRIRRGERVDHYETVRTRKDGELIEISLTVSPVRNCAGKIIGASKIARDITQRKRNEERIVLLAREAEHRTKNLFASVQAMVRLSHSETASGLKQCILDRMQALANVHGALVETSWSGARLHRLAKDEIAVYCQDTDGRASIEGPDVTLGPDKAQVMAMALHELATNAVKYGALSAAGDHIRIEWNRVDDGLVLRWIETGGPRVVAPSRKGFGTRAMQRLITGQLNGTMNFDWRPAGLTCEITMPL
jgi:PAS domain S-box-containing protein